MIENFTNSDEALFQRALRANPSLTREEFNKNRQEALQDVQNNGKTFIDVNGVAMEANENLDPDEARELKDLN